MWKLSHLTEFNNSFSRFRIRLLVERVRGRVVCGCRAHIKGGIIILTIEASEALPLLLFIGIGAIIAAVMLGFDLKDAASIGIIGAADGPTSILVSQVLHSNYIGPIAVAAYSYMALVPIIQPFAIKLVTTKKERAMHMPYNPKHVSRSQRICFPIMVDHRGLHRADVRLARGFSDVRQPAP